MLCWALKANFTNCSRFTTEESSFHDMPAERPRNEVKTVTHVYAQGVTHVRAPCREGSLFGGGQQGRGRVVGGVIEVNLFDEPHRELVIGEPHMLRGVNARRTMLAQPPKGQRAKDRDGFVGVGGAAE